MPLLQLTIILLEHVSIAGKLRSDVCQRPGLRSGSPDFGMPVMDSTKPEDVLTNPGSLIWPPDSLFHFLGTSVTLFL